MKLKSLEISGFKSFANKTKIDFMPGITGVVGPNGSGKSNIIESVRWVLGEQSAKGLRGDRMADVIFGGTATRAPLNRAEVVITFDNSDHYLSSSYSEIAITRTLYRNGDSKYLLNGTAVRLKDIQELFMDSGLGRESFSIISQGRVESIFSAKAEERRTIIEEVAGVYKYKQNKNRAEKELTGTHENLNRVRDILHELEQRLEPLAEQSARAQDYVNQKEQFDALDQARLVLELTDWYEEQGDNNDQLQVANIKNLQSQQLVEEQSTALSKLHDQRLSAESEQQRVQNELVELTGRHQQLLGKRNLQIERHTNRSAAKEDLTRQQVQVQELVEQLQAKRATQTTDLLQLEQATRELATKLEQLIERHPQKQAKELTAKIEAHRNELVAAMQDLADVKNEQKYLEREDAQSDVVSLRLQERGQQLADQLTTLTGELAESKERLDQAQNNKEKLTDEVQVAQTKGKELEERHQAARQTWFAALEEQQRQSVKLDSMNRVVENYDGYNQGVKNLMSARAQFSGLQGVVAELLNVPTEYQVALETALGGALQHVVVNNEQVAKAAIQYLTQHRLGRVTFLPLTTIKGRLIQADLWQTAQKQPGVLGIAATLVRVAPNYQAVLDNLLGTTIVVDTLDHAIAVGKQLHHRTRLVTLDGQLMNAGGSLTGGANRNHRNGLLVQQGEVEQLELTVAQTDQAVQTAEKLVKDLAQQIEPLAAEFRELQTALMKSNEEEQAAKAQLQILVERENQLKREQAALAFELHQSDDATAGNALQRQDNSSQLLTYQERVTDLQNKLTAMTDEQQVLQVQIADADADVATTRSTYSASKARVEAERVRIEELESQCKREENRLAELNGQLADLERDDQDVIADLDQLIEQVSQEKTQAEHHLVELEQTIADTGKAVDNLDRELALARDEQMQIMSLLNRLTGRQAELKTQIQHAEQALVDTYDTSFSYVKSQMTELSLAEIRTQLKLLRRGLDDLGNVNLHAIDEYAEVKTRFDFLHQQKTDLETAQANLLETMSEMDTEVESRFKETFDAIASHFSEIFVKMFGGGQAQLILSDPEHLLTTGIDIKAQPPGKKFQQMSLLSGGEKALTAISLLFAILEVRPVPFAVLDETEAALDEANVDRFARYLHEVNARTQFIVITHRKGTMTQSDVLYGVTMQEPGISTMVSVNLTDLPAEVTN